MATRAGRRLFVLTLVALFGLWTAVVLINRFWGPNGDRGFGSGVGVWGKAQGGKNLTVWIQSVLDSLDENEFKNPADPRVQEVLQLYIKLHQYLGFNRLLPFDLNFGQTRGVTIGRHVLKSILVPFLKKGNYLRGPRCMEWGIMYMKQFLDVCTEAYNFQYPTEKCGGKQGKFLPANGLGFCGDVHTANQTIPLDFLDTVLATQVFEHLQDPFTAINQIFQILKPGGVLLWTAPFVSVFHAVPDDYYRYTIRGASRLIQSAGFCIKVAKGMSSSFLTASELLGMAADDFPREILEMESDDIAPLFVLVIAEKPLDGQNCTAKAVPTVAHLEQFRFAWESSRGHAGSARP